MLVDCMKGWNLQHFQLVCVGLSERDLAVFRAMYGDRTESYIGDRYPLYKHTIFNEGFYFLGRHTVFR